jgi:agmatinase
MSPHAAPEFMACKPAFEANSGLTSGDIAVFGAPYDGTCSFRPGTRFGPDALREATQALEWYSPALDADLDDLSFTDLGNLALSPGAPAPAVQAVREACEWVLDQGARPFMLGGEHSLTSGAVAAVAQRHPDLLLIQLDAHADLRPHYLGEPHSHACAMRRCLDHLPDDALLQIGLRSGTRPEWEELRASGRYLPPEPSAVAAAIDRYPGRPIYLTIDLDVFDPGVLPGTGTPEPGGIRWQDFAALLAVIPKDRVIAADCMELAPDYDPTGRSAVLAAKVVREVMLRMGPSPDPQRPR